MLTKRESWLFQAACFLLAVFGLMGLAGCSSVRGFIEGTGAGYAQEGLQTSEDVICKYAPVGSVIRRYGTNAKKWASFCLSTDASPDGVSNYFGELKEKQVGGE